MKTVRDLLIQKDRIWHLWSRWFIREAYKLDPRTGGNDLMVHNWGNEKARAFCDYDGPAWARWHKIEKAIDLRYKQAEHVRHNDSFKPLWCEYCQKA